MTPERKNYRLWMINHYATAPDIPSGRRHYELAKCLVEHRWSTTVFATPFSHRLGRFVRNVSLAQPFASEVVDGIKYRWLYSLPYSANNWRRYANMLSFAAAVVPGSWGQARPDVVLGSSPHLLAALGAWFVARLRRVPFVLEIRDLWPDTLIQMGLDNPAIIKPLAMIESFLYNNSDHIVVLTEGIRESLLAKGVEEERITFLPNASLKPQPLDQTERDRVREELGWTDDVIAIYAGAHGPANALDDVIEAISDVSQSSNVRMVFIGDGPAKQDLVRKAQHLDRVSFLDPVPKDQISAILRAADIGILSLRQTKVFEGARPNKLFDYMANGLPVVTTIGGEAANVLQAAGAGVYAPPGELAAEILKLTLHPESRRQMGNAGLQYVSSTLTREDTARILALQLERLMANRK